jgi:DNA-3-methyladenine glycosylase
MSRKLDLTFYRRDDVVAIARELLGKVLCTAIDGNTTRAIITETEAYAGVGDRASHAWNGRRTARTEPMYAPGGVAYVYLCYGIHHLFNVVTGPADLPHAVLVRAGVPLAGVETMLARRGMAAAGARLMAGPGTLARALGIRVSMTGTPLDGDRLWLEDHGIHIPAGLIERGPRIGVDYAGDDAALPYRFRVPAGQVRPPRQGQRTAPPVY